MRWLAVFARQVRYEQKLYWRSPSSAVFTFAFPDHPSRDLRHAQPARSLRALGGISYNQYYVPGIIAFGVISACYTNLAIGLCFRRDAASSSGYAALRCRRGCSWPQASAPRSWSACSWWC
jgi:hypothetical protein